MLYLNFVLSLLATITLTSAAPCNKTGTAVETSTAKGAKAVYFITNDAQNAVVALNVNADGTLSDGSTTMTGGQGASGIDGETKSAAGPDALFSQSALKVDGNVHAYSICSHSLPHSDPYPDANRRKCGLKHGLPLQHLSHLSHDPKSSRQTGLHIR